MVWSSSSRTVHIAPSSFGQGGILSDRRNNNNNNNSLLLLVAVETGLTVLAGTITYALLKKNSGRCNGSTNACEKEAEVYHQTVSSDDDSSSSDEEESTACEDSLQPSFPWEAGSSNNINNGNVTTKNKNHIPGTGEHQQQHQELEFLASMTFANGGIRAPKCLCCV